MSLLESGLSAAGRVGRYFSVVTLLPTTALVLYVYLLLASGGGTTQFDLIAGLRRVGETSLSQLVWIAGLAVLLALLVHPLQYPLTQLLEGYWGASRLGIAITTKRILAHRARIARLEGQSTRARTIWMGNAEHHAALERLDKPVPESQLRAYLEDEAATKGLAGYPAQTRRTMPTRLGNVLRRHEDQIGQQYGLRVISVFPHLTHVAEATRNRAASDEQEQMDLALRLALSAGVGTILTLLLLAPAGPWAFFAVVPYTAAYVAYRATCSAAEAWMQSVAVMVDLDRFALYEAMHLPLPRNSSIEQQRTGPGLCDLVEGRETVPLEYH